MDVVLVEDFAPFRRLLVAELARSAPACSVVGEAANGEAGVELVGAMDADAVVMDYLLPGIDGGEATRRILARQPHVKVVGFVGDPRDREALLAAGAVAVFFKTDVDDLVVHLGAMAAGGG